MIGIFDEYFDDFLHPIPSRTPDKEFSKAYKGFRTVEKVWNVEGGVIRTIERIPVETQLEELNRLLNKAVADERYEDASVYKELINETTIY